MLRNLPKDIVPIPIYSKATYWYSGLQYKDLAPKYEFLRGTKKIMTKIRISKNFYRQVLNKIYSFGRFEILAKSNSIALIYYEKSDVF